MSDDEFERFIVINLGLCRLWHQMLKMATGMDQTRTPN